MLDRDRPFGKSLVSNPKQHPFFLINGPHQNFLESNLGQTIAQILFKREQSMAWYLVLKVQSQNLLGMGQ